MADKILEPGAPNTDPKPTNQEPGAQGQTQPNPPTSDEPKIDETGWNEDTKKYIKSLRDENAKHRTKSKDLEAKLQGFEERFSKFDKGLKTLLGQEEGEELSPEDQVQQLQSHVEQSEFERAVLESAIENGIPPQQMKYYRFLLGEALNGLDEDGELSEEIMSDIIAQVQGVSGTPRAAGNSSVDGKPGQGPQGDNSGVTLDAFVKMGITDRSNLYNKHPETYSKLMAEARQKRLI